MMLTAYGFLDRMDWARVRRIHAEAAGGGSSLSWLVETNEVYALIDPSAPMRNGIGNVQQCSPYLKESHVTLDIVGKVVGVSWFSSEGHGKMRTELADLIGARKPGQDRLSS
jgi:hypothetical protein